MSIVCGEDREGADRGGEFKGALDKVRIIWMSNGAFGSVCVYEREAVSRWRHTMQIHYPTLPPTSPPPHYGPAAPAQPASQPNFQYGNDQDMQISS